MTQSQLQYMKRYELKNKAKDTLGGKYKTAILISFLAALIPGVLNLFITNLFSSFMPSTDKVAYPTALVTAFAFSILLSLVLSIVLGMFDVGATLAFLNLACTGKCQVNDLFYGFSSPNRTKILTLSGVFALLQAICLYPYQFLFEYFYLVRDTAYLYASAVALVIGVVVYIPIYLHFCIVYYLHLDFPNKSAKELLLLSRKKMKGQKTRFFLLQLSFLPLMLLCLVSFGIGFLWLAPYMAMTETQFYLNLMNPTSRPSC